jgi:hypothetical protein
MSFMRKVWAHISEMHEKAIRAATEAQNQVEEAAVQTAVGYAEDQGFISDDTGQTILRGEQVVQGVRNGVADVAVGLNEMGAHPVDTTINNAKAMAQAYKDEKGGVNGVLAAVNVINPAYHAAVATYQADQAIESGDYKEAGRQGLHAGVDAAATVGLAMGGAELAGGGAAEGAVNTAVADGAASDATAVADGAAGDPTAVAEGATSDAAAADGAAEGATDQTVVDQAAVEDTVADQTAVDESAVDDTVEDPFAEKTVENQPAVQDTNPQQVADQTFVDGAPVDVTGGDPPDITLPDEPAVRDTDVDAPPDEVTEVNEPAVRDTDLGPDEQTETSEPAVHDTAEGDAVPDDLTIPNRNPEPPDTADTIPDSNAGTTIPD